MTKKILIIGNSVKEYALARKLAKMNLLLNNVRGEINEANSFYADPHNAVVRFDYVMANPPFNVDGVELDQVKDQPRFNTYGVPQNKTKNKKNY